MFSDTEANHRQADLYEVFRGLAVYSRGVQKTFCKNDFTEQLFPFVHIRTKDFSLQSELEGVVKNISFILMKNRIKFKCHYFASFGVL